MKTALEKALNKRKIYLDYDELEEITSGVIIENLEQYNVGLFLERTKFNDIEKAFSDEWEKENKILIHMNQGRGTLQNLMYEDGKALFHITKNDRVIVATIIQWLGTNIGFSFLESALRRCGFKIVKI